MAKWGAGIAWSGAPRGPEPRLWRFGVNEVDERWPELRVGGHPVELERKPLEVLIYFLLHAGETVSKEQLALALWPGRIIEDSTLTKCMAVLRHALHDDQHAVIRTVHGYGYRLAVPVQMQAQSRNAGSPGP